MRKTPMAAWAENVAYAYLTLVDGQGDLEDLIVRASDLYASAGTLDPGQAARQLLAPRTVAATA